MTGTPDPIGLGRAAEDAVLAEVARRSPDAYLLVGQDGGIAWASTQVTGLLGYAPADLVGREVEALVPEDRREAHVRSRVRSSGDLRRAMGAGRYLDARCADGSVRALDIRLSAYDDEHVLAVLRDATDRKELEVGLRRLAGSDPLTGLANRRVVMAHIESALARTRRRGGWLALGYVDLDRFKPINDRYGHEAGDHVLCAVSRALTRSVRDGDLVGRIGGDEFVLVLEDLASTQVEAEAAAIEIVGRALSELARPVHYAGVALMPEASAGVAACSGDGDGDDLLRAADAALYRAKADASQAIILASLTSPVLRSADGDEVEPMARGTSPMRRADPTSGAPDRRHS